jgi:hypothetical protein
MSDLDDVVAQAIADLPTPAECWERVEEYRRANGGALPPQLEQDLQSLDPDDWMPSDWADLKSAHDWVRDRVLFRHFVAPRIMEKMDAQHVPSISAWDILAEGNPGEKMKAVVLRIKDTAGAVHCVRLTAGECFLIGAALNRNAQHILGDIMVRGPDEFEGKEK